MKTSLESLDKPKLTRAKTALISSITSFASQLITFLLKFATRGIIIHILGIEILGLNQTFVNTMLIFSFTELGFIQSLDYLLYQSLAKEEHSKTKTLYLLYKKIYGFLALFVLGIGGIISLFLPLILKNDIHLDNVYLIWFIFVITSCSTYLLRGKRPILEADQRQYIVASVQFVSNLVMIILQIISLYIFASFVIYLLINLIIQVLENLALMLIGNKLYSHIDNYEPEVLSDSEINKIKKVAFGSLIGHLSGVASTALGAMLIAHFNNVSQNGIYGNYVLIIGGITLLFQKISTPMLPAIGQVNALTDKKTQYELFNKYLFATFSISLFVVPVTFCSISSLISVWLNNQSFVLPIQVIIALSINLLIAILLNPVTLFQITYGIQYELIKVSVINAILNVILLICFIGIFGLDVLSIPLATLISGLLTTNWYIPKIIFYNHFEEKLKFKMFIKTILNYVVYIFACCVISYSLTNYVFITESPFLTLIKNVLVPFVYCLIFYLCLVRKNKLFKEILAHLKVRNHS